MIIDQAQPVLASIDQYICADLIDDPGDPCAVLIYFCDRSFSEDITLRTGISHVMTNVFAGTGTVIMV